MQIFFNINITLSSKITWNLKIFYISLAQSVILLRNLKLYNMDEKNIKRMERMDRPTLERLAIALWDELYSNCEEPSLTFSSPQNEKYVKHLESENERLKKAVHEMYQDIKLKSLKYIKNAKPSSEQNDIFFNIFDNYLK